MKIYDCLIIGGGFAGLSAAIYMARYLRSVLIIDNNSGRWNTHEINQNYLGFPNGIPAKKLRELGLKQALSFGAKITEDKISKLTQESDLFMAKSDNNLYQAKTVILATGVKDILPLFPYWQDYWGVSMFWCITCDGYKTRGKKVVVVGQTNEAATTAMQFLNFTKSVSFITNTNPGDHKISFKWKNILAKSGISFYEGKISQVIGEKGKFKQIILDSKKNIDIDFLFNQQGSTPNSQLAKDIGANLDEKGFILTDLEQRTNIPCFFAAGDVTKPFSHQVITAGHEGATAADTANYELYSKEQQEG